MQPVLMRIMTGEVGSRLHRIFTSGSRKEKEQLKFEKKFGPIGKWKDSKVCTPGQPVAMASCMVCSF